MANAVNKALDVPVPSGSGVDNAVGISASNNIKEKLIAGNSIKECSHFFMKYPPLIGKIKACIKCGMLWSHIDFLYTNQ